MCSPLRNKQMLKVRTTREEGWRDGEGKKGVKCEMRAGGRGFNKPLQNLLQIEKSMMAAGTMTKDVELID